MNLCRVSHGSSKHLRLNYQLLKKKIIFIQLHISAYNYMLFPSSVSSIQQQTDISYCLSLIIFMLIITQVKNSYWILLISAVSKTNECAYNQSVAQLLKMKWRWISNYQYILQKLAKSMLPISNVLFYSYKSLNDIGASFLDL